METLWTPSELTARLFGRVQTTGVHCGPAAGTGDGSRLEARAEVASGTGPWLRYHAICDVDWDETKAERYDAPWTHALLWVPVPGIVVTRASGVGDLGSIKYYTSKMDRLLMSGRPHRVFHHWREITKIDPEARSHLRKWAQERGSLLSDAHYLVRSKVLAMAVAVAAMALRRTLIAYHDEAKFVAVLDRAIYEQPRVAG